MATHELERAEGKILVRVLREGKVINGKFERRGKVEVVAGVNGEQYVLDPETALSNYKVNTDSDFYRELLEMNGGKL